MQTLKRHYRSLSGAVLAGFVILNASCAVRLPITEEARQSAQSFSAPKGKAVLFVYRPSQIDTIASVRPVWVNGEHLVSITNGKFVAMPLKPGTYRIQAAAQFLNNSKEHKDTYPEIVLTAKVGETYFIRQSVDPSVGSRGETTMIMLQTGGAPIPMVMGNNRGLYLPPLRADLVDDGIGRSECSELKLIGADPVP